jgi:acid-sensing ion channel, other
VSVYQRQKRHLKLSNEIFPLFSVFEAFDNLKDVSRIPKTHWELETAYESKKPHVYPHRASGSGENGGIQFEIWRKILEVKKSASFNKGFKLVVHLPCEIPQFDKQYYRFPLEKSATLIIRPSLITTEDSLKSYDYQMRQCYFEGEKKLQLFKKYSRSNCEIECLVDFSRRQCNCIHYSMPRLGGDTLCDITQNQCFEEAKKNMSMKNMEDSLRTSKTYDDRGHIACDCLPACTSLQYEGEISHDDIRYFGKYKNNE